MPKLRRWLASSVRPKLEEVTADLVKLAREPQRLALIVLGAAGTTLGAALALWASVEAFGGTTSFVTVTVVTMVGGTLASAAPTPGGVGAVEAALIGGLAAFGVPAAIAVPAVLLYRVLTCWLSGIHRLARDALADEERDDLTRLRRVAAGVSRLACRGW